jgi:Xaa-Pro dipeptidase
MTIGVGGSSPGAEIAALHDMSRGAVDISPQEYERRLATARELMDRAGMDCVFVHAGSNLHYFTGTRWRPSERMVGALIPRTGDLSYIAPAFELGTLRDYMRIGGDIHCWQEHESPYELLHGILTGLGIAAGTLGVDESMPFFMYDGMRRACRSMQFRSALSVTQGCRMIKSASEIALLQCAKDLTLEVQKAAARILEPGITTTDVSEFIDAAHRAAGAPDGFDFCIVLFGEATAYPHGVRQPQVLGEGDMVLVDTGCRLHGYHSDITRCYVYGEPEDRQRDIWDLEKAAQAEAFRAAQPGAPCSDVDRAARAFLERHGFGPGYELPGLPHRTGHGVGLDIHEGPYLVRSDDTPLAPGMCFSNEPMICIPGEFGVRHEDHFYMTSAGPRWFTEPASSIDDPFAMRPQPAP